MDLPTPQTFNPYAIFVAAVTGTLPQEWSNIQHFSWDNGNFEEVSSRGPSHGNDVFAKIFLTTADGREAVVSYDLGDYVYVDCGKLSWSSPLEDEVHAQATWHEDFEAARAARQKELAKRPESTIAVVSV